MGMDDVRDLISSGEGGAAGTAPSCPPVLRLLGAGLAVLALLTGCGNNRYEPGIDPQTAGPLTSSEAELLVDAPFAELTDSLSEVAGEPASLEQAPGGAAQVGGECVWSSAQHAWAADMSVETWDELAASVRPAVEAWGMDDELLDRHERSAGAGLVAENPVNGATLSVQGWNPPPAEGELPPDPGSQAGFSVVVTVPLEDAECD